MSLPEYVGANALTAAGAAVTTGVTLEISLNGAAFAAPANTPAHLKNGWWQVQLNATERGNNQVTVQVTGNNAIPMALPYVDPGNVTAWDGDTAAVKVGGSSALPQMEMASAGITPVATSADVKNTSAEIAAGAWDASRSSHTTVGSFGQGAASVQGNVTGNLEGSVLGDVNGSVASVTGNVAGSVGSVVAEVMADVVAWQGFTIPGAVMIENDAGDGRWTAQALEQAPGGSVATDVNVVSWAGLAVNTGANMIEDDGSGNRRWTSKALERAPGGAGGLIGSEWRWSTSTAATDPGSGGVKVNSGTYASVTEVYISEVDDNSHNYSQAVAELKIGDSVQLAQSSNGANFLRCTVNGNPVDNGVWWTIPVVTDDSGSTIGNNQATDVTFFYDVGGGLTEQDASEIRHRLGMTGIKADPGAVTASLWSVDVTTLIEDSAGLRYTAKALEQAPSGGGGGTDWTDTERNQIRYRLGMDGTTNVPVAAADLAQKSDLTNLDVAVSTRGSQSDLTAVKGKTDQMNFTGANIDANAQVVSDKAGYNVTGGTVDTATSVTNPVTVGTNNDKTGYSGTVTGGTVDTVSGNVNGSVNNVVQQVSINGQDVLGATMLDQVPTQGSDTPTLQQAMQAIYRIETEAAYNEIDETSASGTVRAPSGGTSFTLALTRDGTTGEVIDKTRDS